MPMRPGQNDAMERPRDRDIGELPSFTLLQNAQFPAIRLQIPLALRGALGAKYSQKTFDDL